MRTKILTLGLVCLFFISGRSDPAPYDFVATVISSSRIDLEWKNGSGYNSIEIWRNDAHSRDTLYKTILGHNESWEDINCMPETQYCYRIRGIFIPASADGGKTNYSNEACGITRAF